MSKRLLSTDLDKLELTTDEIMKKWGVNDTEYSKKIKELIWHIFIHNYLSFFIKIII